MCKMTNYKISIIIPVYNAQYTIETCFLSLMNQSIGFENLEIICVDDCSTDNTIKILDNYNEKYENVKIFKLDENSGVAGKPRNVGLEQATADFVMFLDPDDTFYSNACEILYDKINFYNVDIVTGFHSKKTKNNEKEERFPGILTNSFSDYNHSWHERQQEVSKIWKILVKEDIKLSNIKELPVFMNNFGLSSKIFNLQFLKQKCITFPEYIPGEDSTFLLNSLINARGIVITNKMIYSYTTFRNNENNKSVTFQVDIKKNLGRLKAYSIMYKISEKNGMVYEYVHYVLYSKLIYFLETFIINADIPDSEIELLFTYGHDLFSAVCNCDIPISEKYKGIFKNIDSKNYEEAINYCRKLKKNTNFNEENEDVPYINDINVAIIADPFTYNSYCNEFNAFPLEPENWLDQFKNNNIKLLFVESAYWGVGKNSIFNGVAIENEYRPWAGKLGVNLIKGYDNRNILLDILKYCKSNNIPTIFWNKEDPASFDEKKYNFIDTALRFDYIFTTDEGSIPRYVARGHKKVYPLLFASQIKLFNPIEINERSNDIIFAGSWYEKFPNRCSTMRDLFNKIINSEFNLKIYDRSSSLNSEDRKFPDEFSNYIYPKVDFDKMPGVYKESKISLNINTVTESYTMFARRVFELMSSNTFVLSNYSKGVYDLFGDNVIYLDKIDKLNLDKKSIDKICEENLYNVLQNHTYYHRFKYILDTIGFKYKENVAKLNLFYFVENDNQLHDILNEINSIDYSYKKGIIISDEVISDTFNYQDDIEIINFNDLMKYKKRFNENDYFIFRNLRNKFDYSYYKKALCHYQYLDKKIGIKKDSQKYIFKETSDYQDIIFNMIVFDEVLENILNKTQNLMIYNI